MNGYETLIAREACKRLMAAGYYLTVDYERGYEASDVRNARDPSEIPAIINAMNAVDECHLMIANEPMTFKSGGTDGADYFVYFIWSNGNDGRDCVSDYNLRLSDQLDDLNEDWANAAMSSAMVAFDLLPDAVNVIKGLLTDDPDRAHWRNELERIEAAIK